MEDEDKPAIKQEPVIVIVISEEEREYDSFDDSGSEEEEKEEEDEGAAARAAYVAAHSSPYVRQFFEKGKRTIGVSYGPTAKSKPFQASRQHGGTDHTSSPSTYATRSEACRAHDLMLLTDPRFGYTAQGARDRGLNYDLGWTDPEVEWLLKGTRAETAFATYKKPTARPVDPAPVEDMIEALPGLRRSRRVEKKETNANKPAVPVGGAGAGGKKEEQQGELILTLSSSEEHSTSGSDEEEDEEEEEEEEEGAAARATSVAAHSSPYVKRYFDHGKRTIGVHISDKRRNRFSVGRVLPDPDPADEEGKNRSYHPSPCKYGTRSEACRAHDLMLLTDRRFGLTAQEARDRGLNYDLGWTDPELKKLLKGTKAETAFSKQRVSNSKKAAAEAPPPKKAKHNDKGKGGGAGAGAGMGAGAGRGKKEKPPPKIQPPQPKPPIHARSTPGTPSGFPPSSSATPAPAIRPPPTALSEDRLHDPSALADWLSELTRWIMHITVDQGGSQQSPVLRAISEARIKVRRQLHPGAQRDEAYLACVRDFVWEVGGQCDYWAAGGQGEASLRLLLAQMETELQLLQED